MASINDYLPRELLVKVFCYYIESEGPVKFLKNISPVCKLWQDLSPTHSLWKEVYWRSISWNSDHLLKVGERGFLSSTHYLNLSCEPLSRKESEVIKTIQPMLKFEDLLQLIDCCHNLKVLNVSQMNFMTETTLQFIARKCHLYERFLEDSTTYNCHSGYKHSDMVPIDDGNKMIWEPFSKDIRRRRYLDLNSRFGHEGRIISKVADCCRFLEELHFCHLRIDDTEVKLLFPIDEIQRGCPKLQVLKISYCNLGLSNEEELEGFKEIRTFHAEECNFQGHDISKIFKNSTELEDLRLFDCHDVLFSQLPEFPTENVKSLEICTSEDLSEHLEKTVKKWRLTLRKLTIYSGDGDATKILKSLVQESQNRVIEEISVSGYVDAASMKSLILDCQMLRYLSYTDEVSYCYASCNNFNTRESLEEFARS